MGTLGAKKYAAGGVVVAIGKPAKVELSKKIYRGRLTGMLFETAKAFLLPGSVQGMRGLKRYYDEHPGVEVLVVGHADTAGAAAYNLPLSEERAQAIAAFLQDDVAAWLPWYGAAKPAEKRWGVREDQYMLATIQDAAGPCYGGVVDGQPGAATTAAVERFQLWSNATRGTSLAVDGQCGEDTRRALVAAYMGQDDTTLPAGTVIKTHGCGESHPEVVTGPPEVTPNDGVADERNRRVEIFLFEGPIDPPPRRPCPSPGCPEYPIWLARVIETRDLRDTAGEAVFSMLRNGKPVPGIDLVIVHPNGKALPHTTDAKGEVRIVGFAGEIFHLKQILDGGSPVALTSFDVGPHPAL